MADVFISYKQNERTAVEQIAARLRALGLSVWFDASLSAGEAFSDEIDREVRAAGAVLVCWSPEARSSRWVKAEAMIGFEQNKLVACHVAGPDGFPPPTPFNTLHTEDLRRWLAAPSDTSAAWKSVLRRIGRLCSRSDIVAWVALGIHPSIVELRAWISEHGASPLGSMVDASLRALEASVVEAPPRMDETAPTDIDTESDSGRRVERRKDVLILPAVVFAGVVALILVVLSSGQHPPPAPEVVATSYEQIGIGWSRDEVLAHRGEPQLVLGAYGSGGGSNYQIVYRVSGDWRSDPMPEGTGVRDYFFWVYTAPQNTGHQVHVEFDQRGSVALVSCSIQNGFGNACESVRGIGIGDGEGQIVSVLGRPEGVVEHETYRELRYDQIGVRYGLHSGSVVNISVFRAGVPPAPPPPSVASDERVEATPEAERVPVEDQPQETAQSDTSAEQVDVAVEVTRGVPTTCEGQALLYQRDVVVTQIERAGSIVVYTGRPVEWSAGTYRYTAYRDLGLAVGDTFCGYQGSGGRMRVAGEAEQ